MSANNGKFILLLLIADKCKVCEIDNNFWQVDNFGLRKIYIVFFMANYIKYTLVFLVTDMKNYVKFTLIFDNCKLCKIYINYLIADTWKLREMYVIFCKFKVQKV